MGSRTKVSKQVKVTQGDATTTFELIRRGMVIRHTTPKLTAPDGGHGYIEFMLGKPVMDALLELLMLGKEVKHTIPKLSGPSKEAEDNIRERFTLGEEGSAAPDRPPEEAPVEGSGLTKAADKTESGMD